MLLTEADKYDSTTLLTEWQHEASKRIFDDLVSFLETFINNVWWRQSKKDGHENPVGAVYDRIDRLKGEMFIVLSAADLFGVSITEIKVDTADPITDDSDD